MSSELLAISLPPRYRFEIAVIGITTISVATPTLIFNRFRGDSAETPGGLSELEAEKSDQKKGSFGKAVSSQTSILEII